MRWTWVISYKIQIIHIENWLLMNAFLDLSREKKYLQRTC